jgi:hypothetical protein
MYSTRIAIAILLITCAAAANAAPSSISLASSSNPAAFGKPVTLTATVTPSSATGKITFYDGTSILGIATLASGQSSLTTSLLASGARSLYAYYSGDLNYTASTSASLAQVVGASPVAGNGFLPAVNYGAAPGSSSIAIGDFNGDGLADFVVGSQGNNSISVLLGNGNGTFRPAVTYPTPSLHLPLSGISTRTVKLTSRSSA